MKLARAGAVLVAAAAAVSLTACGSGFDSGGGAQDDTKPLTVLIGSSGPAETAAVKTEVAAWSKKSGIKASVQAASNLSQQLAQGFSSGKPADVFYLSTDALAGYASKAAQSMGDAYLLPSIAAVVLGGTSILGGRGTYLGTVAGVVLITLLQSILSVMQMPEAGRQIIYGVVIVAMLLLYGRVPASR